jgi:hypothetical protein
MSAIHNEEYKGLTIKIYQDEDSQNPFEDWDVNPPIAVCSFDYSRSSITEYAKQYGNANEIPDLTREQILAGKSDLLELTECRSLLELARNGKDYSWNDTVANINYAISEHVETLGNQDRLQALETLYNMAGIPAFLGSVHGYSQGDYAEVLAVATPEFQKACGNESGYWDNLENLKPSIQLFEDWAFGNVYGYAVEDQDGETIASLWGMYPNTEDQGSYDGYVLSEARDAADSHVEQVRKDRIEQLKTWIKNRVPYHYRTFAI